MSSNGLNFEVGRSGERLGDYDHLRLEMFAAV